jgi:hypothetical protein
VLRTCWGSCRRASQFGDLGEHAQDVLQGFLAAAVVGAAEAGELAVSAFGVCCCRRCPSPAPHSLRPWQTRTGTCSALPGATVLAHDRAADMFTVAHEAFWARARHQHGESDGTRALIEVSCSCTVTCPPPRRTHLAPAALRMVRLHPPEGGVRRPAGYLIAATEAGRTAQRLPWQAAFPPSDAPPSPPSAGGSYQVGWCLRLWWAAGCAAWRRAVTNSAMRMIGIPMSV